MATSVQARRTAAARSLVALLLAFIILADERVVTDTFLHKNVIYRFQ